ncbi:hypothetical protein GL381_24255 [Salmonella enterica]|uniref:Uncharacterized protein n=1 Tax=Salmonella enterica TaxID=28901 RepID=A0A5Y2ZY34_SALER|nr:hypothetical protein [Salmonella enterica]EAS0937327.1 hypothetical protein [Salmonella enterica]EAT9250838.1 hypothetical protein [Salmonella enterica]EAV7952725.1 hypothetical protein [Salmonella enterica]EAV9264984.1 hypothetical protein [Salmonella enterica]
MSEMNNLQTRQAEYTDMYAKLIDRMQSVRVILEQMSGQEYAAANTYTNNMEMIARFYEEVGVSLCELDFQEYLRQNDLNLFIEILAVGRAISLMKNLLVNVKQSLEAATGKSDQSIPNQNN